MGAQLITYSICGTVASPQDHWSQTHANWRAADLKGSESIRLPASLPRGTLVSYQRLRLHGSAGLQ